MRTIRARTVLAVAIFVAAIGVCAAEFPAGSANKSLRVNAGETAYELSTDIVGNAATATALFADPADCSAGQYATAIAASGVLTCAQVANTQVSGLGTLATQSGTFSGTSSGTNTGDQTSVSGNAGTATALAADGSNCSAGNYARGVDVSGNAQDCTAAAGGGDALVANPLSQFASTTSAQLAGVISNETGSGVLVLATDPALAGNPTAPTATAYDNDTSVATTAFVMTGGPVHVLSLASDATESESTAMAEITGLNKTVGAGMYVFEYYVLAQTVGDAAQSLKFAVNHTGTTTLFVYNLFYPSAGVNASTGAVDQDAPAITTGSIWAWQGTRTKNTTLGPQTGVDTDAAAVMFRISGMMIVTVSGDLELYHGSELTQASGTIVKAGTSLVLIKTGT